MLIKMIAMAEIVLFVHGLSGLGHSKYKII
jgi:hypothetical protein